MKRKGGRRERERREGEERGRGKVEMKSMTFRNEEESGK